MKKKIPNYLPCPDCGEPLLIVSLDGIEPPSELMPCFSVKCSPRHFKPHEKKTA